MALFVLFHQPCVESFQASVLRLDAGVFHFQLLHLDFHFVHLDSFLVAGVLCGNPVLQLPAHQLLFRGQVVQVGPFPGGLIAVFIVHGRRCRCRHCGCADRCSRPLGRSDGRQLDHLGSGGLCCGWGQPEDGGLLLAFSRVEEEVAGQHNDLLVLLAGCCGHCVCLLLERGRFDYQFLHCGLLAGSRSGCC